MPHSRIEGVLPSRRKIDEITSAVYAMLITLVVRYIHFTPGAARAETFAIPGFLSVHPVRARAEIGEGQPYCCRGSVLVSPDSEGVIDLEIVNIAVKSSWDKRRSRPTAFLVPRKCTGLIRSDCAEMGCGSRLTAWKASGALD